LDYAAHLLIIWGVFLAFGVPAAGLFWWGWATDKMAPLLAGLALGVVGIAATVSANIYTYKTSRDTIKIQVKDKERVVQGSGSSTRSRYLIYTPGETFEDTDAFFSFGKTNSSDLYGNLDRGGTYQCTVAGWRVHLFSDYRNLITCKERL
jgi:hypothetical protein